MYLFVRPHLSRAQKLHHVHCCHATSLIRLGNLDSCFEIVQLL